MVSRCEKAYKNAILSERCTGWGVPKVMTSIFWHMGQRLFWIKIAAP
jgi:hypothetical protein